MIRSKLGTYLSKHRERHLARVRSLVEQPCVPALGVGGHESAELLAEQYAQIGCNQIEVVSTSGWPGVVAYLDAGSPTTLISYCMLDTKAPTSEGWSIDPLSESKVDQGEHGETLLGLGAFSRRGPYGLWLNAIEAIQAVEGRLPVNIAFVAESEETIGSPHFSELLAEREALFSRASGVFTPGANPVGGACEIRLGWKGFSVLRLTVDSGRWGFGPVAASAHGMAQGVVESPAWRLVSALSCLCESDGLTVVIPEADQLVPPVSDEERSTIERVMAEHPDRQWWQVLDGVPEIADGTKARSAEEAYRSYYYSTSLNLARLQIGGDPSLGFSIPDSAMAALDLRTPRGVDPAMLVTRIREHLDQRGFADVKIDVIAQHPSWTTSSSSGLMQAVEEACRVSNVPVAAQPFTGGGGPWAGLGERFEIPVLFDVGISQGGRPAGPNEYLVIDEERGRRGLVDSELWFAEFLAECEHLDDIDA